jgi:hypothetical protein
MLIVILLSLCDLEPPFLFTYATAVALSKYSRTEMVVACGANDLRQLKAALNSSSLMCLFWSSAPHGPLVVTPLQWPPHPERHASE